MSYEHAKGTARTGGAVVLLTAMFGCASVNTYQPPSTGQIAAAEASVDAARRTGAAQSEAAGSQLRSAEEELAAGKKSLQAGDNRGAVWSLARAEVDGELSQTLARQARQEAEARKLEGQLAQTRAESGQPPVPPPPPTQSPQP
jgi:hypothetical protein